MYTNIRGLKGKKTSLTEVLQGKKPQIFLITETQLRSDTGITIENYVFYGRKRENGIGGGVGVLVRKDICQCVAPHISERKIEMMWLSIRRKHLPPLMVGVYYGKQESKTSKNEIELEMQLLNEEIEEMKHEGELLIAMDANAKIGLMNENISRNGHLILETFENTGLIIMNKSSKCDGVITRMNTKNQNEKSAIDFILATETAEIWIKHIEIDETGLYKIKGKNDSDHNTISIKLDLEHVDNCINGRHTDWNIRAPSEKWTLFSDQLNMRNMKATMTITDQRLPLEARYKRWYHELDQAARQTIGRTTIKHGKPPKVSIELNELQTMKRMMKLEIRDPTNMERKTTLVTQYKDIQQRIHDQIIKEKTMIIQKKFEEINADKSRTRFWKEKKQMTRNEVLQSLIIKDENGVRIYEPEQIKEKTASYYENLYKAKTMRPHPYHNEVINKVKENSLNYEYDSLDYNLAPTKDELREIVMEKKNGKSTTDIRNEMLKRPGESMVDFLYPLVLTIWQEEIIPHQWNEGRITSL